MPNPVEPGADSPLSPALLTHFSESALAQGRNYLIMDGVLNGRLTTTPHGLILEADVRRSPVRHYHVVIQCTQRGECFWQCSCPFAAQNCEHAAAVLQGWLQNPQLFSMAESDKPIVAPVPASRIVDAAPVAPDPNLRPADTSEPPTLGSPPLRISPDLSLIHI